MDSHLKPRGGTRSAPEADDGCEVDAGEVVGGKLVVAGCDVVVVLEVAKHYLDVPALGVARGRAGSAA